MSIRVLTTLILLGVATAAVAQDDGDWDTRVDPESGLVSASLVFDSGVGVGVRCLNGRYDALFAGLPEAPETTETREMSIQFREGQPHEQRWTVTTDRSVVVSDLPARFARSLREGGQMQVRLRGAGPNGANLRYVFDLPASSAAIDQTLQACDKPLIDPRDLELEALGEQGLPGGLDWAERPRPNWPSSGPAYVRGVAVISCLTLATGRLRDCVVESQHPLDGGFGEAALRGTRRGRIRVTEDPDGAVPTRLVVYRALFQSGQPDGPALGSRISRAD